MQTNLLKQLEEQYFNQTLTEYVKYLSSEIIQENITLIECDDIIGIRINILEVLKQELEYRINSVFNMRLEYNNMVKAALNYKLTEYVKRYTIEQLESIQSYLCCDDLVGIRAIIYEVIRNEYEYRMSDIELKNKVYVK